MIKVAKPFIDDKEIREVRNVLLSGNYVSGNRVRKFEQEFSEYIGVKHGIGVNSGTAALHIALYSIGINPGDEVIVPPITFFATITSVIYQYAVPIFADIDINSYCISPESIEEQITDKTKAIIPVHVFGNSAEMDEIMKIAEKYNLVVLEDCAQAHGTEYKGMKVGSIGDISAFSFFATKHMTTIEGGMILTNNDEWAEIAKAVRSHGMIDRNTHKFLGYNNRMNEVEAAIGLVQLEKLEKLNKKRIDNSYYLINELKKLKRDWFLLPDIKPYVKHTFFWLPLLIKEEKLGMTTEEFRNYLFEKGIETRHRYFEPLYKQDVLINKENYPHNIIFKDSNIDYKKVYLENSEKIAGKLIGLPNHPGLSKNELDYIVNVFKNLSF